MNEKNGLVIVDAERCFFPASEGERLGVEGFGELGVPGGEAVVSPINDLTSTCVEAGVLVTHTLDKHPAQTAHFSDEPNYVNTWPPHGREGTPGSELHPELLIAIDPGISHEFIKGDKPATSPEDDDSYSGALAHDRDTGERLPDYLRRNGIEHVYVPGLAIGDGNENKLCVDSTAVDLKELGFGVTVIIDAVEAVLPENRDKCFKNLGDAGIRLMTAAEARDEIRSLT